jgi:hypothetical protein
VLGALAGRVTKTAMSQRAVCVVGMHRSGTSAIASLLEPIGVHLGSVADLRDDAAGDPHGYWEHRGLKAVSEDLLHRLGADWHRPPVLAAGWQDAPALDDLRAHARRVIAAHAQDHALWGWKDPRASLTLPFWTPLLPPTRYVVCLRHPLEAARSLESRDGLPLWHGLRLWLVYTASALIHTAGQPRILLFYEDAVADPAAALDALAAFLDRPSPPPGEARARIAPERRHERAPDGAGDAEIPDAVRALFAAVRAVVGPRGLRTPSAGAILDAAAAAALTAQRADDREHGIDGWQARPRAAADTPDAGSADAGGPSSSLASAWHRVRRTLGPR